MQSTQAGMKSSSERSPANPKPRVEQSATRKEELSDPTNELYTPIKALSTFNYDWRLKARLTKKYEKRPFKGGKGCLMNIELMDQHGSQIQATFFNDAVEKLGDPLKEGCVYLLSNGQVKIANTRFQKVKNDFQIIFDKNAEIVEVPDDNSISNASYNFVKLAELG
jgi:replication factor A1